MYTRLFFAGAGLGAGLMYLFDPGWGRRRRAVLRDKTVNMLHSSENFAEKALRDAGNRARGVASEARSLLIHADVSDDVLASRVRSRLGRLVSHPHAIEVTVH